MKFIFRWAFRLLILLVVLVVAGILLLDTIVREVVAYQLRSATGLEVKIGKVRVGLFHPEVTIENFILYNRAEFGGSPFIDLPELHVEYDRDALLAGKLHCRLVRFNLAQINLVEDKNGRRNFDLLQQKIQLPIAPAGSTNKSNRASQKLEFAGIDTLNLTLGKATYLRMKQPGQPDEFKMNVNHQVFTNIKSEQDFSSVLLVAFLKSGANIMPGGSGQNWLQLIAPTKK